MCRLDYGGYAYPVEGLGPGRRAVLWVRGCRRRCPGCLSPELWAPGEPAPVEEVAAFLLPLLEKADGLSISGGEPFEQAEGLAALLDRLRERRAVEVLVYTGYLLEELRARGGWTDALLDRIDLLIDGPFREELPNTLQWRGSDNQRVHLLSTRAQRYAGCTDRAMPADRPLQVQMLAPGQFRLIGIPRRGDLAQYHAAMAARGLEVGREL